MSSPLLVLFLRGGADGLSLLAPVGDPAYASRSPLALTEGDVLAAAEGFGLHPRLVALHRRFGEGSVALVPAIGIPEMSRSHFDAQHRVESAIGAHSPPSTTGWLGRHLAAGGAEAPNPWRGVSFGQAGLPHLLAGTVDAIAGTSLGALSPTGRRRDDPDARRMALVYEQLLEQMWEAAPDGDLRTAALSGLAAAESAAELEPAMTEGPSQVPGLADTVAVLGAGLGTEVAVLNLGGWDTHTSQGVLDGAFAALAGSLDQAIDAALTAEPALTVVVFSEFGRRVAPNSSGGCDHGRGGTAILAGPAVSGGLKGDWPGLASLDEGDVAVVNDLRVLMAEVTAAVLGRDPEQVLDEVPAAQLDLFR
jgi:uncharacterized protein (DUF1501 family)